VRIEDPDVAILVIYVAYAALLMFVYLNMRDD